MHAQSSETNAHDLFPSEPVVLSEEAMADQAPVVNGEPVPALNKDLVPVLNEGHVIQKKVCLMPTSNVVRIMRRMLPPHAKITDDAKDSILECVSEFISFITAEANDHSRSEYRKIVTADDILWAMKRLGFDDYVRPMGLFVQRMRQSEVVAGRGSERGDHARMMVPCGPSAPMTAPYSLPVQMQPTVCTRPDPPQGQAYTVPFVPSNAPLPYAVQNGILGGGENPMANYYGGQACQAGRGNHGGVCTDMTSSSNKVPPEAGTGWRYLN
ncbi:hypothetical protein ACP4OV_016932 [Aristida adscensionis]